MHGQDKPFLLKLFGVPLVLGGIVGIIVALFASDQFIRELGYVNKPIFFFGSIFALWWGHSFLHLKK